MLIRQFQERHYRTRAIAPRPILANRRATESYVSMASSNPDQTAAFTFLKPSSARQAKIASPCCCRNLIAAVGVSVPDRAFDSSFFYLRRVK